MSKRQPISPRKKIVLRKPTLDFSITGLIYCTTMMFIGLAAINTQANLLFGVFGLMIGILLASFWVSGIVIRRLRTERILPDHGIVGRPMSLQYRVTNEKRFWPSFAVTVAEIDGYDLFTRQSRAYLLHAPNKGSAVVPSEVIPIRRGEGVAIVFADWAKAVLNNGLGRFDRAVAAGRHALAYDKDAAALNFVLPEVMEAAARGGVPEVAADAYEVSPRMADACGVGTEASCPLDPVELAERLRALAADPQQRDRMRAATTALAADRSWHEVALAHRSIYSDVYEEVERANGSARRCLRAA